MLLYEQKQRENQQALNRHGLFLWHRASPILRLSDLANFAIGGSSRHQLLLSTRLDLSVSSFSTHVHVNIAHQEVNNPNRLLC